MDDADTHGSGCFPCRWSRREKQSKEEKAVRIGTPSPQASTTKEEQYSEKDIVPSSTDYAIEATKKTIGILKGVAALVPFPLVKDILELGLDIISTCEAINDVREKVNSLKNRIATFLLVVAKVSKDRSEENSSAKLSQDLIGDLQELKGCLASITKRLNAINNQNAILTGLLAQPNLDVIDECEVEFQDGVDRFRTLRAICAAQDLAIIQQQLVKLYGITQEVANDVKVTREKVEGIESQVSELKSMLAKDSTQSSNATILAKMPRAPGVFFGRDTIVQCIAEQLSSGDSSRSRVCILGAGGMGKTSTALAIMEHELVKTAFPEHSRFWVPCISANTPTLFLSILSKHVRAQKEKEQDDPLDDVISTLQKHGNPCILLLDNFETPWHPVEGSQETIKQILEALDSLSHVSILVTMRSEFAPLDHWHSERLLQVEPEDSRRIYTAIDQDAANHPELDQLLDVLGHLPYAITLMASRGKRSYTNPKQLLKEWKELGTSMLSKSQQGIDYSISLSIDSKFVKESPGAVWLLQILSMLPTGIYYSDLDIWAKGWNSEAIDTLRDAALVLTREVTTGGKRKIHLFVLPVVQSFMKHHGRIPNDVKASVYTACYRFLAERNGTIKGPNHPHLRQHLVDISSQESNIQALLTEMISDALAEKLEPNTSHSPLYTQRLEALLSFVWFQYWTRPGSDVGPRAADLAQKYGELEYEAKISFAFGETMWRLDNMELGLKSHRRAQRLFETIGDDLMTLRSQIMINDLATWDDSKSAVALEVVEKLNLQWEHRFSTNPLFEAYIVSSKGVLHWRDGYPDDAIPLLEEGCRLFEAGGDLYEVENCKFWLSRCYAEKGDFEAAIEAANAALKWDRDRFGEEERNFIFQDSIPIHLQKVRYLKGADRWGEELESTLKIALESAQELGINRSVAYCLSEFGEIYIRKRDREAARLAYQEVIKRLGGINTGVAEEITEDARHNLAIVDSDLDWRENPEEEITGFIFPKRS